MRKHSPVEKVSCPERREYSHTLPLKTSNLTNEIGTGYSQEIPGGAPSYYSTKFPVKGMDIV